MLTGRTLLFGLFFMLAVGTPARAIAQTETAFTFQGRLDERGAPLSGLADLRFALYDAESGGSLLGLNILEGVPVSGGLFTVELDFGDGAIEAASRWIEIQVQYPADSGSYTALSPRQRVSSTPVSSFSFAPWGETGNRVHYDGDVGIGTTAPNMMLEVRAPVIDASNVPRIGSTGTIFGLERWLTMTAGFGGGSAIAWRNGSALLFGTELTLGGTFTERVRIDGSGNTGFGTTNPKGRIHVAGDYYGLGHLWLHAFEGDGQDGTAYIQARDDSGDSTINLTLRTQVSGQFLDAVTIRGTRVSMGGTDDALFSPRLYLEQPAGIAGSGAVLKLNRAGGNGTMLTFASAGASQGSITLSGSTVSYNAFTGSHYAFPDGVREIARATLVRMTGRNQRLSEEADAELVYGIEPTNTANDPACLGAYLAQGSIPDGAVVDGVLVVPHLVMAAGNGDMWVADLGGGDLEPGDFLISSSVAGCAMKDDPRRFDQGFVIARVAENVEWSEIRPSRDGVRRARVSVMFGAFVRSQDLRELENENDLLRSRLDRLEARLQDLADR